MGAEGLQHGQHRDRDALGELDVLGHVGAGQQRLGQPLADVLLAPPRQRTQPVERLPGDDPHQVRPRVAYVGPGRGTEARPPQPGLLHDVLGVGCGAEHLVGDGEEQAAVGDERVVGHACDATPLGCARGARPHAAENPWASMPRATFVRANWFASATHAVSSTSAGAPSASSSRAESSSVTVGGVWRHRLGVLHDVALQRREGVRLLPPRHLAGLGLVESLVVRLEVPQVEAERAADQGCHRHVGVGLQVLVALVPLGGLLAEAEAELEHRPIVPHHSEGVGHYAEHLPAEPLQYGAVDAGDLGLGNPGVAGHVSSSFAGLDMKTPAEADL